jgi:type IV pilus assembly protein PilM
MWLEVLTAIGESLPRDEDGKRPEDIMERNELHIEELECEYFPDLAAWFQGIQPLYNELHASRTPNVAPAAPAQTPPPADGTPAPPSAATGEIAPAVAAAAPGPAGEGWVIQLKGHHFHNKNSEAGAYVIDTLIKNLEEKSITLPGKDGKPEQVKISDLGLTYPLLVNSEKLKQVEIADPAAAPAAVPMPRNGNNALAADRAAQANGPKKIVLRNDFIVQVAWQPTPRGKRDEKKKQVNNAPAGTVTAAPESE